MISIVIPTYNRREILAKTLYSIERQSFANDNFEVIVVDDGSIDDTAKFIKNFMQDTRLKLKYYYQENSGPARARNKGIEKSAGDIILFCGDDTLFDKKMLYNHELSHQEPGAGAVLGSILWDSEINPTDFMGFLAPSGPQFHFNTIKNADNAGFSHFYASNISLKRKWLAEERFDENFKDAAFEDTDLGLRLEKKGFKIFYNKDAVVYHSHFYTPELFYQKMAKVGRAFLLFKKNHKNDKLSSFKISVVYAPFTLAPFGLRLFNFFSGVIAKLRFVNKFFLRIHWWFNMAYFYSESILKK